ncbi:hypothetical protein N7540_001704 [Penicillium herquei]|nr:hypothetical protein N7540_001704 [Penicillium herquei]
MRYRADYMEDLSFDEAKLLADRLAAISRKQTPPDRSIPMEWIICDIFEEMRAMDPKNGEDTVESTIIYWNSQADDQRASFKDLGSCMTYRMIDSASEAASPLIRFGIELHMTPEECELVKELDFNRSRHISLVNDVVSWDKEIRKAQESSQDGSLLCSCVQVAMEEFSIDLTAAKRMLRFLAREFELRHLELTANLLSTHPHLTLYCRGLEYNMSGDEAWGRVSGRYNDLDS